MNKKIYFLSLAAVLLTACEKGLDLEEDGMSSGVGQVAKSVLQVRTRAGGAAGDEATVAYPVTVYVFQGLPPLSPSDGSPQAGAQLCRAAQTIGDEGQTLNIALTEGSYSVFAVGGASTADYVLPSASDALTTSAIALREGKSHGDLMASKATVTLADGEANTMTLGLERKVMLLQSVVLRKIPTAATAVSVSVSPLWQSLTVGGNYSGTDGSYSLSLEKQSDGRSGDGNNDGNGNGPGDNNDNSDNSNNSDNFPAAGDTYQGCYVLASTIATDGESAELTLLSPNEKQYTYLTGVSFDFMQSKAADLGTDGISGWRIMTLTEAQLLQAAHTALGISDERYYLYEDEDALMRMLMRNGAVTTLTNTEVYLRPVVTVTVSNE